MLRRVRLYSVAGAAKRVDVSEWTIRRWVHGGHLAPVPGWQRYGKHMYRECDIVAAERANRAGRCRRRAVVAA